MGREGFTGSFNFDYGTSKQPGSKENEKQQIHS